MLELVRHQQAGKASPDGNYAQLASRERILVIEWDPDAFAIVVISGRSIGMTFVCTVGAAVGEVGCR